MRLGVRMRGVAVLAAVIGLAACQTARDDLLAAGARPFTAQEVEARLSGNTEIWSDGAAYFSADGRATGVWNGGAFSGDWVATDDGGVCLSIADWEQRDCWTYYRQGDRVFEVYQGVVSEADEIRPGKALW